MLHCFALSWPGCSCKLELVLNWSTWLKKGEIKNICFADFYILWEEAEELSWEEVDDNSVKVWIPVGVLIIVGLFVLISIVLWRKINEGKLRINNYCEYW